MGQVAVDACVPSQLLGGMLTCCKHAPDHGTMSEHVDIVSRHGPDMLEHAAYQQHVSMTHVGRMSTACSGWVTPMLLAQLECQASSELLCDVDCISKWCVDGNNKFPCHPTFCRRCILRRPTTGCISKRATSSTRCCWTFCGKASLGCATKCDCESTPLRVEGV